MEDCCRNLSKLQGIHTRKINPSKYNCRESNSSMVHKIQYFDAEQIPQGEYLQDVVNDFLAQKGEKIIAVHPVLGKSLLVHYKE